VPESIPPESIPYVRLNAAYEGEERDTVIAAVDRVFRKGDFVQGDAVERFEKAVAAQCGVAYAVALNSGTDALIFAMKALGIGPGDEVITPPNSFVASTSSIVHAGATPVFADVLDDQNIDPDQVARRLTPRTKAIMAVHLTGRCAQMHALRRIAGRHGLFLIEDAAQAFGSLYDGVRAGALGDVGCFSAHPLKNLNAAGDAGFITTNNGDIADRARALRNHGLVDRDTVAEWGYVSRLDTLQAEILLIRLAQLPDVVARRRRNAAQYRALLDSAHVFHPPCRPEEFNTFHTFVIQVDRRDALKSHLADKGIGTAIHYPKPIHLQPAAASLNHKQGDFPVTERQAGRILTLPIHQGLTEGEISTVARAINAFYGR
jgi:dTDP-4-amino-4,6-dideoxygalactose transaminase